MGDNAQLLAADPDKVARQVAEHLRKLGREAHSDLVYTPTSGHSYYRDLLVRTPAGDERLKRHGEQMDRAHQERRESAERRMQAAGFEYRIEPNRTDGQGGYFAPPLWLNQLFATANRPGRVLASLIPARFDLPRGASSINLPILTTGTSVQPTADTAVTPEQDLIDQSGSSAVVPLAGVVDVALQLLEQSPVGAHVDWALFMDMSEAYDADLEQQLLAGIDGSSPQLLGLLQVAGTNTVPYVSGSPTASGMWPLLGQAFAKIGDNRLRPPECWLMRSARWAWIQAGEDGQGLPFGLSPVFIGKDDDSTPDPISGLYGLPVFLDDAIPANLTATVSNGAITGFATQGTQDVIVCLRPSDLILLEGEVQTMVTREPLSGSAGARLRMHGYAAAITGRRPAGISVLGGTGAAVQSGF